MDHHKMLRFISFMLVIILMASTVMTALAKYDTIPFGEQSDTVRKLQQTLKDKGYYKGSVDGKFGPTTKKAVSRYQASIGLRADGKPGNRTLTALYDGGSKALNTVTGKNPASNFTPKNPKTLYYGCTGSRVQLLQRALKAAGFFKGSIDGKYGDMTELAVRKFQTKKGLHVDGIAGAKTLARLNTSQKRVKVGSGFLLSEGSKGSVVASLQQKLISKGYIMPITSGYFDANTTVMVKAWQGVAGKPQTGTVTESEYNAFILGK